MTAINTEVELSDTPEIIFAKMTVRGDSTKYEKHIFYDALLKLADKERGPNDTDAQAFSKVLTGNKTGQLLYAALKAAPGFEVKPAPEPEPEKPAFIGPAHAKLHAMAIDNQRAHNTSYASSYARVYTRPENSALRAAARAEHMAATMAGVNK